jgi:hypothetical protein
MATTSNFYRVLIEVVSVRNPHTHEGRIQMLEDLDRYLSAPETKTLDTSVVAFHVVGSEDTLEQLVCGKDMVAKPTPLSLLVGHDTFQPEHAVFHGVLHNMRSSHGAMLHAACVRLGLDIDLHGNPL